MILYVVTNLAIHLKSNAYYMHILASPSFVHDFASAMNNESVRTITPNATQMNAGSRARLYQGRD